MTSTSLATSKPRVLVLSGWYPSILEPNNGDFVKEQIQLLRREGVLIDLIYVDLNIAYILSGKTKTRTKSYTDRYSNRGDIMSGPFWPKNQSWGLNKWVKAYAKYVLHVLEKRGDDQLPQVIHAHTYLGGAVASIIQQRLGIKYIITEHYTGWLDGSIKDFHKKLATKAFQNARSLYGVSPPLSKRLQEHTSANVETIPNFIDLSLIHI